jgi:hypothetical protein
MLLLDDVAGRAVTIVKLRWLVEIPGRWAIQRFDRVRSTMPVALEREGENATPLGTIITAFWL